MTRRGKGPVPPGQSVEATCEICGGVFEVRYRGRRHLICSRACRHELARRRRGLAPRDPHGARQPRGCDCCGATFTPSSRHPQVRFCSDRCRWRAKERRAAGRDERDA